MQRQIAIDLLPDGALDAQTAFMAFHLEAARALLADPATTATGASRSPAIWRARQRLAASILSPVTLARRCRQPCAFWQMRPG